MSAIILLLNAKSVGNYLLKSSVLFSETDEHFHKICEGYPMQGRWKKIVHKQLIPFSKLLIAIMIIKHYNNIKIFMK